MHNDLPKRESNSLDDSELPTHSEDGVDLTLIRWMLSLTPEERLDVLQSHARALSELRDAFQKP